MVEISQGSLNSSGNDESPVTLGSDFRQANPPHITVETLCCGERVQMAVFSDGSMSWTDVNQTVEQILRGDQLVSSAMRTMIGAGIL